METDIATMTAAYLATRLGILAVIGYLGFRLVCRDNARASSAEQSHYAMERLQSARNTRR